MIDDADAWEDVAVNIPLPDHEALIPPSHEGGDQFRFTDMARESFSGRYVVTDIRRQTSTHQCLKKTSVSFSEQAVQITSPSGLGGANGSTSRHIHAV
jgi:hypothetical protein